MISPNFTVRIPPLLKKLVKERLQKIKEKTGKKITVGKLIVEVLWEEIKKPLF